MLDVTLFRSQQWYCQRYYGKMFPISQKKIIFLQIYCLAGEDSYHNLLYNDVIFFCQLQMRYNILGTITCYNKHSSVTKSCRTLCKNIVLLRTELDKCIPNVYSDCIGELELLSRDAISQKILVMLKKNITTCANNQFLKIKLFSYLKVINSATGFWNYALHIVIRLLVIFSTRFKNSRFVRSNRPENWFPNKKGKVK